ncbi:MAG: FG-GAP-like repeat-containing protein, partial [Planctomycetota bacterium]
MTVRAQRLLAEHRGTTVWSGIGYAVAFVGDVDKDGFEDYAIGEPRALNAKNVRSGSVHVFSGRDHQRIRHLFGDGADDGFGLAVSAAGDVNRDGYPDLIVGAPGLPHKGYARVFSGRDGKILHTFSGTKPLEGHGWSVARAGDLDKDGHDDVLVGSWGFVVRGTVWLRSGKDGSVLRSWQGPGRFDVFGFSIAGGVDLNGDGFGEVLIASPNVVSSFVRVLDVRGGTTLFTFRQDPTSLNIGSGGVAFAGDVNRDGVPDIVMSWPTMNKARRKLLGAVRVYSGKLLGGKPLHTWIGGPNEHLGGGGESMGGSGPSVSAAGDVDRDGYADILVGMASSGIARLYSGKDGRSLYTFADRWGLAPDTSVAGGMDIDKDGYPDLLVGNHGACACKNDNSRAWLFSGLDSLRARQDSLSISGGGIQLLSLDAGPGQAGNPYLVLGSMTGTHPGIRLGPVILPLHLDAYTFLTLRMPNIPPFLRTLGLLDASGKAQAAFVMPRGLPPSLAGLELNHAFVTSGRPGRFDF